MQACRQAGRQAGRQAIFRGKVHVLLQKSGEDRLDEFEVKIMHLAICLKIFVTLS